MSARPVEFRMIVAPATTFAAIDRALSDLGLVQGPDDAATPPMIPGEREFASWSVPDGDAQIHYSFNPVVSLRVLTLPGGEAVRWKTRVTERLPESAPQDIRASLRASSPREILLGLYAVAELAAVGFLPEVQALRVHRERL